MAKRFLRAGRMMTLVAAGTLVCGIAISGCSSSGGKSNANATNSNCTPKWHFTTISKGVLTVIAVNNPPTIQIDPNTGKAEGVDAEVLPKFAKDNCLTVRWEALDGAAAVAAMSSGRGDVGSGGWGITAKRGKVIGQMSSPTFCDGASVLSKQPIASYDALKAAADKGVTVGVEGGSLYQQPLTSLIGSSHVRVYQSVVSEIQDLKTGRIGAVYAQEIQTHYQAKQQGLLSKFHFSTLQADPKDPALPGVTQSNYPFTKSNTALGAALEAFIAQEKASGAFQKILTANGFPQSAITCK